MKTTTNIIFLPLRILFASIAAPFAIHKRSVSPVIAFLALFGFWEVFNGVAKEPLTQLFQEKSKEYQSEVQAMRNAKSKSKEDLSSDVLYSNYRAGQFVIGAGFRAIKAGLTDDGTRLPNESRIDCFVRKMSRSIDLETQEATLLDWDSIGAYLNDRAPTVSDRDRVYPEQFESRHASSLASAQILAQLKKRQDAAKPTAWNPLNWPRLLFPKKLASGIDESKSDRLVTTRTVTAYTTSDIRPCTSDGTLHGCGDKGFKPVQLKLGQLVLLYRGPKREPAGAVIDGVEFRLAARPRSNGEIVRFWLPCDEKTIGVPAVRSAKSVPLRKVELPSQPKIADHQLTSAASVLPAASVTEAARSPNPVGPDVEEWPVSVNDSGAVAFYPVSEAEKAMIKARNYKRPEIAEIALRLQPKTEVRRILSGGNSAFAVSMPDGTLCWLVLANNMAGLVNIEDYRERMHRE